MAWRESRLPVLTDAEELELAKVKDNIQLAQKGYGCLYDQKAQLKLRHMAHLVIKKYAPHLPRKENKQCRESD